MAIKTVILDRDGTLYNEYSGQLQPGVPEMLDRLRARGLNIFVVSNEQRDKRVEELLGVSRDQCLYHVDCGVKGSKSYVRRVIELTGNSLNEMVYLGDSELDMREAAGGHERIALFNAEWSNPGYNYGFSETTPGDFVDDLERYFLKEHLWYFTVDSKDSLQRPLTYRALLDPDTCKTEGITALLKERKQQLNDQEYALASHLVMHLLASFYLEGLYLVRERNKQGGFRKPVCCIYPGRSGEVSPVLRLFERFAARLLTMTYSDTLLQRHTPAPSSHVHRMSGKGPQDISVQFNSVQLNPAVLNSVIGNVVFIADDFSTGSNAMETARNLLYAAGASRVIGVTVGKYGDNYTAWTPGAKCDLPKKGGLAAVQDGHLVRETMPVVKHPEALALF